MLVEEVVPKSCLPEISNGYSLRMEGSVGSRLNVCLAFEGIAPRSTSN